MRDTYPNPTDADDGDDDVPHALEYETASDLDQRYLKLMKPDRSTIVSAVILASVILSGLLSCALAGMFWILILKLLGEQ